MAMSSSGRVYRSDMKELKAVRNFIWDFDGTLFDSYPMILGNMTDALRDLGYAADPGEMMGLMLQSVRVAMDVYARRLGITVDALFDAYSVYYRRSNAAMEAVPMADVEAVLTRIRDLGGKHFIFTHRDQTQTADYLRKYGLDGYFRESVGVGHPHFAWKPAPDAVRYLMEAYAMDPAQTVMVGDRDCDLASGRNAGIGTVHLLCPTVPEKLDCDWEFESLSAMLRALN